MPIGKYRLVIYVYLIDFRAFHTLIPCWLIILTKMKNKKPRCSRGEELATNDSTPLKNLIAKCCTFLLLTAALLTTSCKKESPEIDSPTKIGSVYVLNEGNFGSNNATLTVYDPVTKNVIADIFSQANNGAAFGDSPTSIQQYNGKAYITISNSGKIYIIDPKTGVLTGKITNLNSPRHIEFISATKAYVSNVSSNMIDIINPQTEQKVGDFSLGEGNYAERFVRVGDHVYTNTWSYGTKILKIDIATNKVVGTLEVGIQPTTLLADANGKMWTLTDGGYQGNPLGEEEPAIVCIDIKTFKVEKRFALSRANAFSFKMEISADGQYLYYIARDVFKMSVIDTALPTTALINGNEQNFYGMGVNPENGEIYLSDAIDFQQAGKVNRYDTNGKLLDTFKAWIIPGAFGFIAQ